MKPVNRVSLGRIGEVLAANYLKNRGYTIEGKNLRTPYGEIDLLARYDETIIFVEVKTRASSTFGPPEISITPKKEEHMRSAAEYYIQQHPAHTGEWRIDLVTIQLMPNSAPAIIDHFENVLF